MKENIYIHSFHPILPQHHLSQKDTVNWILNAHEKVAELKGEVFSRQHLLRFGLSDQYIEKRFFDIHDVDEDWSRHEIYRINQDNPEGVTLGKRNQFFGKRVEEILGNFYEKENPSHIIHVTCTGYLSPSPVQSYFSKRDVRPSITHAYHMGCYASIPAIRIGTGLCYLNRDDVDVVHTEMCSLHLSPVDHSPEQIVVQTLFADGHIKYTISREKKGVRIIGIKELLLQDSTDNMTWVPDAFGMKMTLSREVPFRIRDSLPGFMEEFCRQYDLHKGELLKKGLFAIHPGGPKIIEAVQKKLELADEQVSHSKNVLRTRGNMSSATLPHVWHEILQSNPERGTRVLGLAFGPGLTVFGILFEVV